MLVDPQCAVNDSFVYIINNMNELLIDLRFIALVIRVIMKIIVGDNNHQPILRVDGLLEGDNSLKDDLHGLDLGEDVVVIPV